VAIDHGCSGYIYGLSIAKGLVTGGIAKNVLLVTAETYTKYIAPEDKSTRSIFGDGAAAILIDEDVANKIGAFSFGSDGSGAEKLIVRDGKLFMDGPDIFNFTLDVVPRTIEAVLKKNNITREDIDLYVFHQANKYMLDTIRKVNALPRDKFYVNLEGTGNTVSSTIPIALKQLDNAGKLRPGMKVMLLGFGVGLSWGGTVISV
jgi:3-oxoacyl-[acyl-carrier-protein] synthase-3